jgi:histidinol-phosphate aminotransferase
VSARYDLSSNELPYPPLPAVATAGHLRLARLRGIPLLISGHGAEPLAVPLADERHDLKAMATAITDQTRMVIVCNPHNPTGTVLRSAELSRFLDTVPRQAVVMLDEAYREFVRDPDVPDGVVLYREHPNVVVLRTFSKAHGETGRGSSR